MSIVFHPPEPAIDAAVGKLKDDGLVHPDASFNEAAEGGLRKEVTYRDYQFAYRLGRTPAEVETVDAALELLRSRGLVPRSADYDRAAFERFRPIVKDGFEGTWTSLSPTMERLIYMLASVRRPCRSIELGSFWGYTLAWFAGPAVGRDRAYAADAIYGVDIDADMTERARENFGKLTNCEAVELIAEDARTAVARLDGPFDFVYIEAKSEEKEGLYLELLRIIHDKLEDGAWVMAHDCLDWTFQREIADYLAFVRSPSNFSESICFDIDHCGMELSIR